VLGDGFALVGLGFDPRVGLRADARDAWHRIGGRFVTVLSERAPWLPEQADLHQVRDLEGLLAADAGSEAVLVRPDRYVFAACRRTDVELRIAELAAQLAPGMDPGVETPLLLTRSGRRRAHDDLVAR
jgi:hypothetical protein